MTCQCKANLISRWDRTIINAVLLVESEHSKTYCQIEGKMIKQSAIKVLVDIFTLQYSVLTYSSPL